MSAEQLNAFLIFVGENAALQRTLRASSAIAAADLARAEGFDVTVADLTRYKARSTTWQLSERELEVVAHWQPADQPFWWQHIWPGER